MELTREIRDKRVAIARDMLKQLGRTDVPLWILDCNGYIAGDIGFDIDARDDLQPHVEAIQAKCAVCELGGLVLSKARLYDDVPASVLYRQRFDDPECFDEGEVAPERDDLVEALSDIFDKTTLDRLEAAFECSVWPFRDEARFGEQFDDPISRARAVTQLLIDGDGEFILPAAATTPEAGQQNRPSTVP